MERIRSGLNSDPPWTPPPAPPTREMHDDVFTRGQTLQVQLSYDGLRETVQAHGGRYGNFMGFKILLSLRVLWSYLARTERALAGDGGRLPAGRLESNLCGGL